VNDNEPIRVCILTETYYPVIGGGETQARALAAGLEDYGCTVQVITRRSELEFPRLESVDNVPVRRLGPAGPGHLKKWAMLPGLLIELLRKSPTYDVLLVCGFRVMGISAVIAAKLLRKPVALKADNEGEMSGRYFDAGARKLGISDATKLLKLFVGLRNSLLLRADAFISLSSDIRAEFETAGVSATRLVTIPNSVDENRFRVDGDQTRQQARQALNLPLGGVVVVFTGRLLKSKGVLDLVESWAVLAPEFPAATLVIVGSGQNLMHNCEAEVHQRIQSLGIENQVVTTGFVRNVEDYLKAADVFAFPTTEEAFGISLIEAMSAGLAVVAARVGGIKDIIQPEANGLLIEPHDGQALTRELRRLLVDSNLRSRLGRQAVETVTERYSTETILRKYAELFGQLVARKK
jgi:glycosyltransferase involved in cell wall biosynthesis